MSTTQPEFTMSQYASKDDMIGAMRQHIAELESRVQELGQMARDANSRRVIELEAELAAMRAGGEPVAEMVPYHTPSGKRVAVISRFQHLPIGTKLYTHPKPAAQDAERIQALELEVRQLTEQIAGLRHALTPQADSQPAQAQAGAAPRYRLLVRGRDTIQADDEFLREDGATWLKDPSGIFVGCMYEGTIFLPARRAIDEARGIKGGQHDI